MKPEPEPTGSNLPAPYRNPWRLLGRDLRAVLADAGLRARELFRRNREGDLWRPAPWPASLAALFWPLLLLALLLAVLAPGFGLRQLLPQPAAAPSALRPAASSGAAPLQPIEPAAQTGPAERSGPAEANGPAEPVEPVEPSPPNLPEQPLGSSGPMEPPLPSQTATATDTDTVTDTATAPANARATVDPLLARLSEQEADPRARGLILSTRSFPAEGLLRLGLSPEFAELPAPARVRQAERWRQRAEALGFEHLELRDGTGRLLGRSALVGSGMILLDIVANA